MMDEIVKLVLSKWTDPDAEELRRNVLEKAIRYVGFRFQWELWSREKKMENDSSRTSAHDSFMDATNIFIRYINKRNGTDYADFRDRDRKDCGDVACRIVYEVSISNR